MKVALEVSLRKQRPAEDYREVLEVCHNEVLRLGTLAERLLTLSRLDSEQYGLRMVPAEMSQIVNSALEAIRSRARECGLELSVGLQEAEVVCDLEAIRQVVDNLIDNALRHAPSGGTIEIELTLSKDEAEFAVVNDRGNLNLDSEERLFDRFYRSDSSRDRKTGGAGLGLAIVAAFVKAHGGRCGARAVPADRVAFWFTLPRALS
jgi:signal transduction histidine kinase